LSERMVLVSGAAGGIGAAVAKLFTESGWRVIGVDKRAPAAPIDVDRFFEADISSADQVEQLFMEIEALGGRLEALVNNAAIQICKPLVETEPQEWDEVMAANVRSVYLTSRAAYRLLKAAGGSMINVSSVHALATSRGIAAYAASKGALLALTRALALELAPRIRVNAVLPGAVDTAMLSAGVKRAGGPEASVGDLLGDLAEKQPLGRLGAPRDIAEMVLFLADPDRSAFITGQTFVVDGGALARLSTE
jgi:NAD(P)-dependent dehydrogenase (short-subunit alcohol dehydrogenase family)